MLDPTRSWRRGASRAWRSARCSRSPSRARCSPRFTSAASRASWERATAGCSWRNSLLGLVLLAAVNRSVLLARLAGDGPTVGRPAMQRLAAFVTVEAGLALAILGIVAALSVTPPAPPRRRPGRSGSVCRSRRSRGARGGDAGSDRQPDRRARPGRSDRRSDSSEPATAAGHAGARGARGGDWGWRCLPSRSTPIRPRICVRRSRITRRRSPRVPRSRENCAACHGATGAGDGPAALSLLDRPPI